MATVFDGVEFIMSGDVVSGLVLSDNAIYDAAVGSGGLLISAVVGGFEQVDISSGGEAASGGLTIGAQVASGGQEEVASGAVSSDAQIIGGTECSLRGRASTRRSAPVSKMSSVWPAAPSLLVAPRNWLPSAASPLA